MSDDKGFFRKGGEFLTNRAKEVGKEAAGATVSKAVDTAQKAGRFARRVGNAVMNIVQAIISIVMNPIFWVTALVVSVTFTVVMTSLASYSVIGRNDLGDDCGTGDVQIDLHVGDDLTEEQIKENAFMIMNWMMQTPFESNGGKPFTKMQAAAMVANMKAETSTFNPSKIQDKPGDYAINFSNEQAMGIRNDQTCGEEGSNGLAMGMFQHRCERAEKMINLAKETGRKWNDAAVQLELFAEELSDPSGRGEQFLKPAGFYETGHTLEEYTHYANTYFGSCRHVILSKPWGGCQEASLGTIELAHAAGQRTYETAKELEKEFTPIGGGSTASHCVTGADYSDLIELAKSLSEGQISDYVHPCSQGPNAAYLEARAKQIEAGLGIGTNQSCSTDDFADCGKYVATLVTLMLDKDYVVAGTGGPNSGQWQYVSNSPHWEMMNISESEMQTGDVLITKPGYEGHTLMYLGEVDGKENMATSANWDVDLPRIHPYNYVNFRDDCCGGREYAVFRYVGPANNGILG